MATIKLTIEYDGTEFNGWQIQHGQNRTIQGEIEKACQRVFKKHVRVTASGRTDSGVHALGQVAHINVDTKFSNEKIVRALNASLPVDITVIDASKVSDKFHARFNAKSKIYRYTILRRKSRSALQRHLCNFYPYPLNIPLMRREAKILLGRKDFKSFAATPNPDEKGKNTVRVIKDIRFKKQGDWLYIDIEASGFLHKMVRNIVGTLLTIGNGRLPEGSTKAILAKKNRIFASKTAPAKGLCLLKVKY